MQVDAGKLAAAEQELAAARARLDGLVGVMGSSEQLMEVRVALVAEFFLRQDPEEVAVLLGLAIDRLANGDCL